MDTVLAARSCCWPESARRCRGRSQSGRASSWQKASGKFFVELIPFFPSEREHDAEVLAGHGYKQVYTLCTGPPDHPAEIIVQRCRELFVDAVTVLNTIAYNTHDSDETLNLLLNMAREGRGRFHVCLEHGRVLDTGHDQSKPWAMPLLDSLQDDRLATVDDRTPTLGQRLAAVIRALCQTAEAEGAPEPCVCDGNDLSLLRDEVDAGSAFLQLIDEIMAAADPNRSAQYGHQSEKEAWAVGTVVAPVAKPTAPESNRPTRTTTIRATSRQSGRESTESKQLSRSAKPGFEANGGGKPNRQAKRRPPAPVGNKGTRVSNLRPTARKGAGDNRSVSKAKNQ